MEKNTKRYIATIVIGSIVVLLNLVMTVGYFFLPIPIGFRVLVAVVPFGFAVAVTVITIIRIKEIKGGEQDDSSQY